jgi:tRNA dimethylallyltransferase
MKALGVPELAAHLAGSLTLDQAVAIASQATRNYAKRQLTWFRHQLPDPIVVPEQFSESLPERFFPKIRQSLLTPI